MPPPPAPAPSASPAAAPSLRARLIGALLAAVALIGAAQALVTWRTAQAETQAVFDAQMQHIALSLTGDLAASVLGESALGSLGGARGAQDLILQIWRADGVMLYRSPSDRLLPPQAVTGFSDLRAGGRDWRVYVLQTPTQIVQIAQDSATRRQAAGRLALRAVLPIALLAPLLMLIVWGVVTRALAPLGRVRQQLAARRADDLAPLAADGLPAEVRPLIDELNALLARLALAWDALTHFSADAAHELRTPLAALRLQAQSLQRAATAEARALASQRLASGIDRATHLVEQLLALARQEAARSAAPQPVDLCALAQAAMDEARQQPGASALRLLLQAPAATTVPGQPEALALLLRNLLGNALRHAPQGRAGAQSAAALPASSPADAVNTADAADAASPALLPHMPPPAAQAAMPTVQIQVLPASAGRGPALVVEDSGPGIAAEDRARVLDRFYRVPGTQGAGSGLGLAIVQTIARQHGARLHIGHSPTLGGARVELRFAAPWADPAQASPLRD